MIGRKERYDFPNLFLTCRVAIEQQYSLGYSLPANKTQIAAIINAAKARGAPPPQCCQAASAFNKARCQCDSSLPQVLGNNFNYLITPKGLQSGKS